ncbi:MAG: hypothetical protein ACI4EN_08435 [Butyrivibrio sp.]
MMPRIFICICTLFIMVFFTTEFCVASDTGISDNPALTEEEFGNTDALSEQASVPLSRPMKYISSALIALSLGFTITFFIVKTFYGKNSPKEEEVLDSIYVQHRLREPSLEQFSDTYK